MIKSLYPLVLCIFSMHADLVYGRNLFDIVTDSIGAVSKTIRPEQKPTEPQSQSTEPQPQLKDKQSVAKAQRGLSQLGYDVGKIDGLFGNKTAQAIREFQHKSNLRVDGVVTANLLNKLEAATADGASNSQSLADAQKKDKKNAALIGGAAGAGAGLLLADEVGVEKVQGATVGGLLGGAIGYLVGNETAERRGDYAHRYDEVDLAIKETESRIVTLKKEITNIESRTLTRNAAIRELNIRYRKGENVLTDSKKMLADLNLDIEERKRLKIDVRKSIKIVNKDIDAVKESMKNEPGDPALLARRDQLISSRDELVVSLDKLNSIDNELLAQRENVTSLGEG